MTRAGDTRVFFKRKALKLLRSYWCQRWDNAELRSQLSLTYEPKYYIESEHMNGFYVKLRRLDFLWYRGLFSIGRHLPSGRYYRDPVHLPLSGLGPREMVFPGSLLDHLDRLTLLGNWVRYQMSARGFLEPDQQPVWSRSLESEGEKLAVRVFDVLITTPPAVVTRWGHKAGLRQTICLKGEALNTPAQGLTVVVALDEVFWNLLPGYSMRYLRQPTCENIHLHVTETDR